MPEYSYSIITDSTTDLPQDFAESLGLEVIPYQFRLGDRQYMNYLDHRELSARDFYDTLREGTTGSTSLVTAERYIEAFLPHLKKGRDILYMCLSTGLSSSYSQSIVAATELSQKYPERRLIMIDTLCASMGQGLLAYYSAKARDSGKSIDELSDYINELVPQVCHWVGVDDLQHLRRGGRVSGASAFVGTLLSVKPVIHMDEEGKLIPVAKVRGWSNLLDHLAKRLEDTIIEPKDQIVFISHSDAPESAQKLAELVIERAGKREILINDIGPVIGAHTGPGTVAMFFIGSER